MNGDFQVNNLKMALDVGCFPSFIVISQLSLTQLWLDNRTHLGAISSFWNRCSIVLSSLYIRYLGQSLSNAKLNVVRVS